MFRKIEHHLCGQSARVAVVVVVLVEEIIVKLRVKRELISRL